VVREPLGVHGDVRAVRGEDGYLRSILRVIGVGIEQPGADQRMPIHRGWRGLPRGGAEVKNDEQTKHDDDRKRDERPIHGDPPEVLNDHRLGRYRSQPAVVAKSRS
jgi:hypothetical protein